MATTIVTEWEVFVAASEGLKNLSHVTIAFSSIVAEALSFVVCYLPLLTIFSSLDFLQQQQSHIDLSSYYIQLL